jgi:hypothetical protein
MYVLRRKILRRKYFFPTKGAPKVMLRAKRVDIVMFNKPVFELKSLQQSKESKEFFDEEYYIPLALVVAQYVFFHIKQYEIETEIYTLNVCI